MLIVCPSCASRYEINPAKLGPGGRKVRCPSCAFEWLAHGQGKLGEEEMMHDQADDGALARTDASQPASEAQIQDEFATAAAMTENAPVMRPDQSAEDFVEQEWNRAAAIDETVSAVVGEAPAEPVAQAFVMAEPADMETSGPQAGAEMGGTRKAARPPRKKRKSALNWRWPAFLRNFPFGRVFSAPSIAIAGSCLLALLVGQREFAVRHVPQLAGAFKAIGLPVNLQGLVFEQVKTELVEDRQGRFLIVQGEIRNVAAAAMPVPPIEIVIQDDSVKSLYTWTAEPSLAALARGESLPFRSRLASPPQSGAHVMLRFSAERKSAQK